MTNESLRLGNVSLTSRKLRTIILSLFVLLGIGNVWGAKITYSFSSKSWAASPANWTSGKDGNSFQANQGIQITTGATGANGTSPLSFTGISKIEVQYCTNASKGVGTIKVKVGSGTEQSFSVTKPSSGGTTLKTATFNFSPVETGSVKVTGNCTTNSVYIWSVTIYYQTAVTLNANGGTANRSATFYHEATSYQSFTACARDGYTCTGYWTASSGGTKILNADGSFAASNITVSAVPYISSSKWAYVNATLTLYAQWESAAVCGSAPTVSNGSLKGSVSSSSSATVQCTSGVSNIGGAGCSMTSYGFAVGTSADPTIGGTLTGTGKTYEVGSSIAASTVFEKLIDGLAANTTYHVRSYATNGAGTGYGADFTFTTLAACTAAPTVTAGSKGTITSTTAAVTCSSGISSLGTGGCEITSYGFVYGTSANPTTSNSTKEVGKTYTSTGVSFNTSLTGLTEGQFYYVRPYATNGFGTNYGTQVSFGTPKITVSETARAFGDRAVGGSYTMTFTVSGTYLQGNINIAKSGTNQAMFSIDNATVTQTDGTAPSTTITVTYSPSAAGSHSATLTLTSTNATSKTVSLTGTGKYKVTWMAGGSVFSTQVADANTALSSPGTPSPATYCPGGKVFVGWSANTIAGTSNTQPTDLFTDATKKKMPAGGITYYAVYATSTGSSSTSYAAITSGLASGDYVIAYKYNTGTQIVLKNVVDGTNSSTMMEGYNLSLSNSKYSSPAADYIWQLQAQQGGGYYIYNLAVGKYLAASNLTSSPGTLQFSNTPTKYDITYDGTNSRWTIRVSSSNTYYVHGYVNSTAYDFRVSTSGSGTNYKVFLYKNEGSLAYSAYATTCCTNLDDINGSVSWSNPTTAVVSWDNIANVSSWTVKYKTGGGAYSTWAGEQTVYTKTTSNDSRKVTITSLTPCANYDFQIIASPASGYCDKDQTINDTQTHSYSVTFPTLTGTTKSSGTLTSCASGNYVATFTASSVAYALPDASGVTVTIGGSPATITTDYTWSVSNGTGTLTVLQASITGDITISVVSNSVTCESTPTLGAASLSGTFNLTTVGVSCANITPGTYCAVESGDYGFIWYSGTGDKVIGNDGVTKVAITSGDYSSGSFAANLSGEFTTGTTYSYRAFAENTGDNVGYSTTQTFKPQSVTFNKDNGESNVVTYVNYNTAVSEPSAPSKTGYDFDEWQLSGSQYNFSNPVTSNITLTATWNALTYEVTLAKDYGSAGSTQVTATFGSAMPDMGTKPSRSGYTFQGYFDDHNGAGTKYYNSDKSSARNWDKATNTTLYASWSPKNYTITLNNQGADTGHEGTANISVTYDSNTNLSGTPAITKPEKTGYVFAGYYTAADGGGSKIIDEDGNVVASVSNYTSATKQWIKASDVELHAYWKRIYTVKWSVNGNDSYSDGVVTGNSQVVTGEKISAMATAPADNTLSSCASKFMGWSCKNFGSKPKTTASGQYDDLFTTTGGSPYITQDTTFYAVFAEVGGANVNDTLWFEDFTGQSTGKMTAPSSGAKIYGSASIIYLMTGGTGTSSSNKADTEVKSSDSYALGSAPELMIGKGNTTAGSYSVSGIPTGGATELTLQFKRNSNSLTPTVSAGYSISKVSGSGTDTYVYTITCGEGSTFNLLMTGSSSNNVRVDDILVKVKTPSYSNYRTQCDANMVRVTYAGNGGSTTCANGTHDKRTDYTVCSSAPTRDYYSFTGWLCSADSKTYAASATIDDAVIDADFTLTAQWTPVPYDITYELDGGTNNVGNPAKYNVTTATITLQDPTKGHDRFDGWYDNGSFTGDAITSIPLGSHGNVTLYAKWAERHHIEFFKEGVSVGEIWRADDENMEDAVAGQGSVPSDPSAPTACSSKVFVGWSESEIDDETDTKPSDLMKSTVGTVDEDKEFHAVWAIVTPTDPPATYAGTGVFEEITSMGDLETGTYYVLYGYDGESTHGALKNTGSGTEGEEAGTNMTVSTSSITNPSTDIVWKLGGTTDAYTLYNQSVSKYIEITTDDSKGFALNASATSSFKVTVEDGHGFFFKTNKTGCTRGISIYTSTSFRCYALASAKNLRLFKLPTNTVTAYCTSCCATKVTLSAPSITDAASSGSTITFDKESPVTTCGGSKTVTATVTLTAGYEMTALSFSGGSVNVSPAISTPLTSSQNYTLTFAEGTNATLTTTATVAAKALNGISLTPSSGEVYDGQYVTFTVNYDPADYLSKGYSFVTTPSYVTKLTAGVSATTQLRLQGGRGGVEITEVKNETVSIKASGDNTKTASVDMTINPLPRVHFVDLVHGKEFADVVATISENELNPNKTTKTSVDWTTPNANTCETNHLHLVGWIRSDWPALEAYLNGTGDKPTTTAIVGAGSSYFFAPDASINVQTFDGKTFYAVWAKVE